MKKRLATAGLSNDIVAVRHDLPHMPSLGVSSLDSRPPWQHGGLLFSAISSPSPISAPRLVAVRCSMGLLRRLAALPFIWPPVIRPPADPLPDYRPVPA